MYRIILKERLRFKQNLPPEEELNDLLNESSLTDDYFDDKIRWVKHGVNS